MDDCEPPRNFDHLLSAFGLDLLDFQQAITGYKVVYEGYVLFQTRTIIHADLKYRKDIKTLIYTAGLFSRGKKTAERGRLQIWNPRRLERAQPSNGQFADMSKHRRSVATGSTGPSTAPSTALSLAKSFTTSYTFPITTENTTGFNFEMPGLPILVFYLRADESGKEEMSFLSVESEFSKSEAPKLSN